MFGSKNKDKFNQVLNDKKDIVPDKKEANYRIFSFIDENQEDLVSEKKLPRVYSRKNKYVPEDAVYVGVDSPYGNPYKALTDGGREAAIKKYADYLFRNPELLAKVIKDLKGKNLVCHCTPLACHGDVLLLVANPELDFNNKFTDYDPDEIATPNSDRHKMIPKLK